MGTTPTPGPHHAPAPAGRPPTAPPDREGGVHRWSEVDGDERRGYTMTCADWEIPAWGGTSEMARKRAAQMDRRLFAQARQGRPPESIADEMLGPLDDLEAAEPAPLVRNAGMGRGR